MLPFSAMREVWVYDRVNAARKKITDTAGADPCFAYSYRPTITSLLQDYWGADRSNTSGYDLSGAGAWWSTSSSGAIRGGCQFLAAAGVLPAPNLLEPQAPSISKDGRFVAFTTDFDAETVARVTDDAAGVGPVATENAFLYDRVLGATTRLTRMPASAVAGQAACCPTADPRIKTGSCSHKNRLLGQCCEQKPCRRGATHAEVSGDGQKVAFVAEVAYGGTSVNSPDGDLELFIHHIPTDTTHRISHTFDQNWDETYPHLNHDGTVIVWESKSHYGAEITADSDGNKDVWMTRLTYGCDDPNARNYEMDADIAECCHYVDATIGGGATSEVSLTLQVDLADALNRTLNTPAADSCAAWRDTVISDLACALRVPANLITSSTAGTCAALSADAGAKTIAVSVTFHPGASGPTATELQNKLVTALKDARSQVWSGLATRYTLKAIAASNSSILFTRDSTDDAYEYIRGTSVRVSIGNGTGSNRSSSTARISGDGAYIVYESGSDELGLGMPDNVYHIYRMEVATGTKVLVTPVDQASDVDSKYPSSSADGKTICYLSNAPSSHANQCDDCGREDQWWVAKANDANTGFGTPTAISWSSTDGRKAASTGRCQVSDDGSAIVFSTDSDLSAPSVLNASATPVASGDHQVWITRDDGATATLISGSINDPSNTAGVAAGSDCHDPTLNSDGSLVAFRCKKKLHPSGYQPGSTADDEGWLYDHAANKLTLFAEMNVDDESACAGSSASKADLLANLSA
jgi:Tol biopolymer transport system component